MAQFSDLIGKTALITGASSGLGTQFARCLSVAGVRVILVARRVDKLQNLASDLGNALAFEMNVADKGSVNKVFATIEELGERIDICINNAGIARATAVFESDESDNFESIMQTNVMGVWYVTKAVAQHMKANGIHGSIINIGSINGDGFPSKHGISYNASKAAVLNMTKSLAGDLSPHNIRINAISPGYFPTDMTKNSIDKMASIIPLGFIPDLSDIDGAILYFASNQASRYVTGTTLTLDGGISWGGIEKW